MPSKPKNEFLAAAKTPETEALSRKISQGIREVRGGISDRKSTVQALKAFLSKVGYDELIPGKILDRAGKLKELKRIGDDDSTATALAMLEDVFDVSLLEGRDMNEIFTEIEIPLKDMILRLFSSPQLKHDDESIDLVYKNVTTRMEGGARFLDALMDSLDQREGVVRTVPSTTGTIDGGTGVVTPVYKETQ